MKNPALPLLLTLVLLAGQTLASAQGTKQKKGYETIPPTLPPDLHAPAILVFSKTNGYRHVEAIPAANAALAAMAKKYGWSVFFTENAAIFNTADLKRFCVTIWNNTSGDCLTLEQQQAFQSYMENGGGFVGIHGAGGDTHYDWRWYVESLIGAQFKGHPMNPQFQIATIHIEKADDPATRELGTDWVRTDEWYSFAKAPGSQATPSSPRWMRKPIRPKLPNLTSAWGRTTPSFGNTMSERVGHFSRLLATEGARTKSRRISACWKAPFAGPQGLRRSNIGQWKRADGTQVFEAPHVLFRDVVVG